MRLNLNQIPAAYRAFAAGLDMDMASGTFAEHLAPLVKEGRITTAAIDAAVRPILAAKIRLGLFEHPYVDEALATQVFNTPEHRQVARLAAHPTLVSQWANTARARPEVFVILPAALGVHLEDPDPWPPTRGGIRWNHVTFSLRGGAASG